MLAFQKLSSFVLWIDLSARSKENEDGPYSCLGQHHISAALVLLQGKPGTSSASLHFPLFPHRVLQRNTAACKVLLLQCCNQQGTLKLGKSSPVVPQALCFAQQFTSWFCTVSWQNVLNTLIRSRWTISFWRAFIPTFLAAAQLSKWSSCCCLWQCTAASLQCGLYFRVGDTDRASAAGESSERTISCSKLGLFLQCKEKPH